jgi:hypothetical protein
VPLGIAFEDDLRRCLLVYLVIQLHGLSLYRFEVDGGGRFWWGLAIK